MGVSWLIHGGDPNHLLTNWDDPPSWGRTGTKLFMEKYLPKQSRCFPIFFSCYVPTNVFLICSVYFLMIPMLREDEFVGI